MAKRTLNAVEKFFIEKNMERGVDWLAEQIGGNCVKAVEAYCSVVEARPQPVVDNFARQHGAVIMTDAQSQVGDLMKREEVPSPKFIHQIKK